MTQPRAFFTSRVDTGLFAIAPSVCLVAAVVALPMAMQLHAAPNVVVLIAVVAFTVILPVWLLLDTNYTLTTGELFIRSGPFRWCIALSDVEEVSPSSSWTLSPALSLDRLRICYGTGCSVLVSPREKQRFIDNLRQRCPAVLVTGF